MAGRRQNLSNGADLESNISSATIASPRPTRLEDRHLSDAIAKLRQIQKRGSRLKICRPIRNRLWVNKEGFHSNNIESLFNVAKKWSRGRNGQLAHRENFNLYLSMFMFRHNTKEELWADGYLASLRCNSRTTPTYEM